MCPPTCWQDAILDVVTSGQIAWDGLQQRAVEPFKSLGIRCLVFGNGDDDVQVRKAIERASMEGCLHQYRSSSFHIPANWGNHGRRLVIYSILFGGTAAE